MTPAEELRAAAAKIRATAEAATPGPWRVEEIPPYTEPILMRDLGEVLETAGTVDVEPGDQAHIALWHPGVAELVADALDELAGYIAGSWGGGVDDLKLLAVARAINGGVA